AIRAGVPTHHHVNPLTQTQTSQQVNGRLLWLIGYHSKAQAERVQLSESRGHSRVHARLDFIEFVNPLVMKAESLHQQRRIRGFSGSSQARKGALYQSRHTSPDEHADLSRGEAREILLGE